MIRPSLQDIMHVANRKGYAIFEKDEKEYNINIWGYRSADNRGNSFNDLRVIFWKYKGQWNIIYQDITTDPGLYWREHPINPLGTAVLKEGQIRGGWKIGLHKGYPALVQAKPVTVIRDANRDNVIDLTGEEDTGYHGINMHRSKNKGESVQVDKWSAGCQVAAEWADHEIFMHLCREAAERFGGDDATFTYTLVNENDFL